jgi:hypothetical protein
MPCRKWARRSARGPSLPRIPKPFLAALAILGLAGCGSHLGNVDPPQSPDTNSPPGAKLLATLLGMKSQVATSDGAAVTTEKERHIFCPEVRVLEGTEASRAYAGSPPSGANLRYQYSITDTARECALDVGQLALKIGVAGKVLLGPAGSAGSFTVPVRMAILRKKDNEPELSKLYHATVNVDQSETQAEFSIISELLHVPFIQDHSEQDYIIKVGIDEGQAKAEKPHKGGAKR